MTLRALLMQPQHNASLVIKLTKPALSKYLHAMPVTGWTPASLAQGVHGVCCSCSRGTKWLKVQRPASGRHRSRVCGLWFRAAVQTWYPQLVSRPGLAAFVGRNADTLMSFQIQP